VARKYRQRMKRRRERLYLAQNGRCAYCGCLMDLVQREPPKPNEATFDHVIPKSRGGRGLTDNTVLACRECNRAKGNSLMFSKEAM
jgi:5-methylcytosine-specific restriction endonuclease McrA